MKKNNLKVIRVFITIFYIYLVILLSNCTYDTFLEIPKSFSVVFPDTTANDSQNCCILSYDPEAQSMSCDEGKAILKWEDLESADEYDVFINNALYTTTTATELEIGEKLSDDLTGENTFRLHESKIPYDFFVIAKNDFQKQPSQMNCFYITENECEGITISKPVVGSYTNPEGYLEIEFMLVDKTAIEQAYYEVNGAREYILHSSWNNQKQIEYSVIIPPPDEGWTQEEDITVTVGMIDAFGNECSKSVFVEVRINCYDYSLVNFFPPNWYTGYPPFNFSWNPPGDPVSFIFQYRKIGAPAYIQLTLPGTQTTLSLETSDLSGPGSYEWRVSIINPDPCQNYTIAKRTFHWNGCATNVFSNGSCGEFICGNGFQRKVNWSNIIGAQYYLLEMSDITGLPYDNKISDPITSPANDEYNIMDYNENFYVACSIRVRTCRDIDYNRPNDDPYKCKCFTFSPWQGLVCANAANNGEPAACGGIEAGNQGCPCDVSGLCSPGTGCGAQLCS
jgi:hypothetical protein